MKKVKLSKRQQELVDFMQEQKKPVYISRGLHSFAYFGAIVDDPWTKKYGKRGPLVATILALIKKGVLELVPNVFAPWYRYDYHLTKEWKKDGDDG